MITEVLSGNDLAKMFKTSMVLLGDKYKQVDALNVFPVPDGDTGTNMYLTLVSAVKEVGTADKDSAISVVADAAARGALMGARGNSGVILSQLLRGIARGLKNADRATGVVFAQAIDEGVKTAYKAIMKPVEGTILTVAREAAAEAGKAAGKHMKVVDIIDAACRGANAALDKTPEMLPVLKEAGVVDAGGMGWLIILSGFKDGIFGQQPVQSTEFSTIPSIVGNISTPTSATERIDLAYPYCTELLINMPGNDVEKLIKILADLGDSLIAADSQGVTKVHIHSAHPGSVIEECLRFGPLINIKVENMKEQLAGKDIKTVEKLQSAKQVGIVSVAAGDGIKQIMESLGADCVVTGGQTMNPSTHELLLAIQNVNAETVIILPNNKNIIMTANQVSELADKEVLVLPTTNIPQGIAALIAYKPDGDKTKTVKSMADVAARVKSGEVTRAVRDTKVNGNEVTKGSILGISNGEISCVGNNVNDIVLELLKSLITTDEEVCTLYYGDMISGEDADALLQELEQHYQAIEFEIHYGGQPLYYYLVSIE